MTYAREMVNQSTVSAQGIRFQFAGEKLDNPVDWSFSEGHHVIVVHRAGRLERLSSEFSSGLSSDVLPQSGDCWVVPAGTRYAAEATGSSVEYCELHLPVAALPRGLQVAAGLPDAFLFHAVEQLALATSDGNNLSGLLQDNIAQNIRLYLGGDQDDVSGPFSGHAVGQWAVLASLEIYLRDTISDRHSLEDMAAFTGLAPSTLLRQFRQEYGTTPYRWLIQQRMERAKHMLHHSSTPITEIALDVGFSTPSHFADQFRKSIGFSPRSYRAMMQN